MCIASIKSICFFLAQLSFASPNVDSAVRGYYGRQLHAEAITTPEVSFKKTFCTKNCDIVRSYSELLSYAKTGVYLYLDDAGRSGLFKHIAKTDQLVDSAIILPAKKGGYWMRMVTKNSFDVRWFGAKGEGTDDTNAFLSAIRSAAFSKKYLFVPNGIFHVSKSLIIEDGMPGIIGENKFLTVILPIANITTMIVRTPGILENFTIGKYAPLRKNRVRANGISFEGEQTNPSRKSAYLLSTVSDIIVKGLDGFGLKYNNVYDSYNTSLTVEQCGNSENYAFQVLSSNGETSNVSTWDRLQVENCYRKAIFIHPLVLSCKFSNVHAERQEVNPGDTVFYFGGNRSYYDTVRLQSLSDGAVLCIDGYGLGFNTVSVESKFTVDINAYNGGQILISNFWMPNSIVKLRRDQFGSINMLSGTLRDYEKNTFLSLTKIKITK